MAKRKNKRKKLSRKLFTKNRLVILNEDSFEEIFSLRLTLMNVFVFATLGAIVIISVTTFIIAFTPLREFIPGYSSGQLKRNTTQLALQTDSIQTALTQNQAYLNSIRKALTGQVDFAKLNRDSIKVDTTIIDESRLKPSEAETNLRDEIGSSAKPKKKVKNGGKSPVLLQLPLRSIVSVGFDADKNTGAQIHVSPDAEIRTVTDATLLFLANSPKTGGVALLQYDNGYTVTIRGIGVKDRTAGDRLSAGELIGTSSKGKELLVEVWNDGVAVDPDKSINYK